jgi:hypothetical protein
LIVFSNKILIKSSKFCKHTLFSRPGRTGEEGTGWGQAPFDIPCGCPNKQDIFTYEQEVRMKQNISYSMKQEILLFLQIGLIRLLKFPFKNTKLVTINCDLLLNSSHSFLVLFDYLSTF